MLQDVAWVLRVGLFNAVDLTMERRIYAYTHTRPSLTHSHTLVHMHTLTIQPRIFILQVHVLFCLTLFNNTHIYVSMNNNTQHKEHNAMTRTDNIKLKSIDFNTACCTETTNLITLTLEMDSLTLEFSEWFNPGEGFERVDSFNEAGHNDALCWDKLGGDKDRASLRSYRRRLAIFCRELEVLVKAIEGAILGEDSMSLGLESAKKLGFVG